MSRRLFFSVVLILLAFFIRPGSAQMFTDNSIAIKDSMDESGINTITHFAHRENIPLLNAVKEDSVLNALHYYSNGYYTKWEAEDTTLNLSDTGIKANFGGSVVYKNTKCWTSGRDEQKNAGNLLLFGPHYRQDKKYNHLYLQPIGLIYELKFKIAGDYIAPQLINPIEPVCKVSVVFSYEKMEFSLTIL